MEEAPWSDTSRSSVSSCGLARLYLTFIPEIPSFWNRVAFLNKVTFRMWTVTACAIHRPHFKHSLQNMAPGASFEYGQRFTVNIWPLKPQMVFSSLILLFHMHVCLKDVNWKCFLDCFYYYFFYPRAHSQVQNLIFNLQVSKQERIEKQTFTLNCNPSCESCPSHSEREIASHVVLYRHTSITLSCSFPHSWATFILSVGVLFCVHCL